MSPADIQHRPIKSWTKITITTTKQLSNIVACFLATISEGGVEFHSDFNPQHPQKSEGIAVYIDDLSQVTQKLAKVHLFLADLERRFPRSAPILVNSVLIQEEDWGSSWKKHFKSVQVTNRLTIKPSWETCSPEANQFIIEMDPGMAFGTGLHASTQLSLQLIDALYSPDKIGPASVLDVGTGTGVLGMSCALLGCPSVVGIDNDIDARVAAEDNIQRNNLSEKMTITDADLADIEGNFKLVIANIIHNTLLEIASLLVARMADRGYLILAGILAGQQIDNINEKFCALGLEIIKVPQKDEWSATCLQKV